MGTERFLIRGIKRSKNELFLWGLYFALGIGMLCFFIFQKYPGYLTLYFCSRYNFYFCFLISVLGYFLLTKADRYSCKEIIEAERGKSFYEKTALKILLLGIFLWNLLVFALLLICNTSVGNFDIFLPYSIQNYPWNVLFPQLVCALITYLLLLFFRRRTAVIINLLFLFLISPFAEKIVWKKEPPIPVDRLYDFVRHPFMILYQNGEWSPNIQTGLQTELVRKEVFLFWFILFAALVLFAQYRKKKLGGLLLVLSLALLLFSYRPASAYRLNDRWDGIQKDFADYGRFERDNSLKPEEETGYRIASYQLSLELKDEMKVRGELVFLADRPQEQFTVTLHKNYQVKELESLEEENPVWYEQKGDYVYIHAEQPTERLELRIVYKGHHPQFYANRQEAMLPGWFPWYPMAGEKQIFAEYHTGIGNFGYNPYNRMEPAEITLQVESGNKNITTNLEGQDGTFAGRSDSITLMMGNIKNLDFSRFENYLPLDIVERISEKEYVERLEEYFREALEVLENTYGLDVGQLWEKKIILMSKDIGRLCGNTGFAVFDEYILADWGSLSPMEILDYFIYENEKSGKAPKDSLLLKQFTAISKTPEGVVEDMERRLEMSRELAAVEGNTEEEENLTEMWETIALCVENSSEEEFVKRITQYALGNTSYENDREFADSFLK